MRQNGFFARIGSLPAAFHRWRHSARTLNRRQQDPKLARVRAWIGRMQERLAGYPHLYSGVWFEPHRPLPEPAPAIERAAFWLGGACMVLAFPITVPLIVAYVARVRWMSRRSG